MDEEALNKFLKEKVAEKVIKGYLVVKKLKEEKNYGNTYIQRMYKFNPDKYEKLYGAIEEDIKKECEAKIKEQIKNGELNLDDYLVEMYKERVKAEAEDKEGER